MLKILFQRRREGKNRDLIMHNRGFFKTAKSIFYQIVLSENENRNTNWITRSLRTRFCILQIFYQYQYLRQCSITAIVQALITTWLQGVWMCIVYCVKQSPLSNHQYPEKVGTWFYEVFSKNSDGISTIVWQSKWHVCSTGPGGAITTVEKTFSVLNI